MKFLGKLAMASTGDLARAFTRRGASVFSCCASLPLGASAGPWLLAGCSRQLAGSRQNERSEGIISEDARLARIYRTQKPEKSEKIILKGEPLFFR